MTQSDKERIKELEAQIWELESIYTTVDGNKYANRDHPRFKGKPGNPYIPLDEDGNMQHWIVG